MNAHDGYWQVVWTGGDNAILRNKMDPGRYRLCIQYNPWSGNCLFYTEGAWGYCWDRRWAMPEDLQ